MSIISTPPASEIKRAEFAYKFLFIVYLAFLLGTVILTLLVWQAGNKYQDAVKRDADAKITTARAVSDKANKMASEANKRVEEIKKENLSLQIKLEEERSARLEIERRLAPRFLTAKEQSVLIEALRPFAGHPINITIFFGDIEAGPYGKQIANVFEKAGWNISVNRTGHMGPPAYGVTCSVSSEPDVAIKTLIATFKKVIPATVVSTSPSELPGDHVAILVGLKP